MSLWPPAASLSFPFALKALFNLRGLGQTRPIKIPLIVGGGGSVGRGRGVGLWSIPLHLQYFFRQLIACLLSGCKENMRGDNGARGPLSCHGQSSGPIRKYGGTLWCFDRNHLRTIIEEGRGGCGSRDVPIEPIRWCWTKSNKAERSEGVKTALFCCYELKELWNCWPWILIREFGYLRYHKRHQRTNTPMLLWLFHIIYCKLDAMDNPVKNKTTSTKNTQIDNHKIK